jgi:hypothetical protein
VALAGGVVVVLAPQVLLLLQHLWGDDFGGRFRV